MSITVLLVVSVAGLLAAVGSADDPRFDPIESSIGPSIVDAGSPVLVKASWQYDDTRNLNNAFVRFTLPAGWTLVEADPDRCDQTGVTVNCPVGRIRQGDLIAQEVELQTGSALGLKTVEADLIFSEGPDNPGRQDTVSADDVTTTVISANEAVEPNRVGKCVSSGGGIISTAAGVGNSEASATVPDTDELCTPFSITERVRLNATETCIPNYACTLDVVTTDSAPFPATDPIELKIVFRGQGISNLPLLFVSDTRRIEVPECDDPDEATPDPCYSNKRNRQQSVTWTVNWTGLDPGWTG